MVLTGPYDVGQVECLVHMGILEVKGQVQRFMGKFSGR